MRKVISLFLIAVLISGCNRMADNVSPVPQSLNAPALAPQSSNASASELQPTDKQISINAQPHSPNLYLWISTATAVVFAIAALYFYRLNKKNVAERMKEYNNLYALYVQKRNQLFDLNQELQKTKRTYYEQAFHALSGDYDLAIQNAELAHLHLQALKKTLENYEKEIGRLSLLLGNQIPFMDNG
ncbi:MAG: hypothetical protein LE169_05255 [Endomicrobium sp.]|nr:hypothetical protein [Endomicrobium sp.]